MVVTRMRMRAKRCPAAQPPLLASARPKRSSSFLLQNGPFWGRLDPNPWGGVCRQLQHHESKEATSIKVFNQGIFFRSSFLFPHSMQLNSTPSHIPPVLLPSNPAPLFYWLLAMTFCKRSQASSTFSLEAKALRRKKPSPPGPKPAPGVVTIWAFSRISLNMSQLFLPPRSTYTYGPLSPPYA